MFDPAWIAVLYALGNVTAGAAAIMLGRAYDRRGLGVLIHSTLVPALFAPLVVLGGTGAAVVGALRGIGFGVHDTPLRAAVAIGSTRRNARRSSARSTSFMAGVVRRERAAWRAVRPTSLYLVLVSLAFPAAGCR